MQCKGALGVILVLGMLGLFLGEVVCAQTMPAVPEFTLKFIDNSYEYFVEPVVSTTIDPYTGEENVTIQPDYTEWVENKSIEVTIRNQAFVSTSQDKYLFYNVRLKGHYGEFWNTRYREVNFYVSDTEVGGKSVGNLPMQSDSQYTRLYVEANNYEPGSQIDFQVQAVTGYDSKALVGDSDHPLLPRSISGTWRPIIAVNQRSSWSDTQTITIPEDSPSVTPSATPISEVTTGPTQTSATPSPVQTTPLNQLNSQTVSQTEFYTVTAILTAIIAALTGIIVKLSHAIKKLR